MYQVCYAGYQVSFYLRWFRPKWNYQKVLKYYGQDCLKNFFSSLLFQWWFNFLEKVPILAQKCLTTNRQNWKFSKVKFWPKPRIQNSVNTKPLNLELLTQLACFIFTSWLEKCFEVSENIQKFKCEEDYGQKFVSSDNPRQNIWHKLKKYSKMDKTSKMYLIGEEKVGENFRWGKI